MSKRKNKIITIIVLLCLVFSTVLFGRSNMARADTNEINFNIEESVDKTTVYTGEEFTYTIKYRNANVSYDAHNVVITDELPANIEYVSFIPSQDIEGAAINGNIVTFNFKEPLKAGVTGFVKIIARFPKGTTLSGESNKAVNFAKITGSNGPEVYSNSVTVTPMTKAADWSLNKTIIIPSTTAPAIGYPVTYAMDINGNSAIGGLNLHDVTLTDSIPVGAEYISSSNGGTYNSGTGQVTWNIGDLGAGTSQRRTITLNYLGTTFSTTSSATNIADAYAQLLGSTDVTTKEALVTHGFADPSVSIGSFTKSGRQSNDRYSLGQTAQFGLGGIENTGNVPLDKIEIVDNIPEDLELKSITTGKYNYAANVKVQYQTTGSVIWIDWPGTPIDSPNNQSLSTDPGEKVSGVKWIITNGSDGIPAGFKDISAISVQAQTSETTTKSSITNTAAITATKAGNPDIVKSSSKDIYITNAMPWLVPTKSVKDGQVKFNMNDTVEYDLKIKNHDFATGDYVNPVAIDVIPKEMESVQILGWDKGNSSITEDPVVDTSGTRTIGGISYNIIKWNFNGTLKPGEYVDVKFSGKIKNQTLAGKVTNTFYITTTGSSTVLENPNGEQISDQYDLDGDSDFGDKLVAASNDIFVNFVGSVDAQKWVKGELDSNWGYFGIDAGYGKTLPGGAADYRLKIKNTDANGTISNLVAIDELPYVGDTGVIDTKARGSEWRPYLVNMITGEDGGAISITHKDGTKQDITTGTAIYYSTNANPSKQELTDPVNNKGLSSDGWSTALPDDITTVKSLKFDFGSTELKPEDEIILEWPMRAPYSAPAGKIAWNSFGYGGTYPDVNGPEPFLPSEPKKVGFEVQPDPNAAYYIGDYVWEDMNRNGIQDDGDTGINGILANLYEYSTTSSAFEYTGRYTRTGNNFVTGKSGYYEFPNVAPGKYEVQFVFPKEYKAAPYK